MPITPTGGEENLEDSVSAALTRLEEGELNNTVAFRDENLAALLAALEETGLLEPIIEDTADRMGRGSADISKSDAIALLIRAGLEEYHPDIMIAARSGYRQHLVEKVGEF